MSIIYSGEDFLVSDLLEQIVLSKTNESYVVMTITDYRNYNKRIKALAMIKRLRKH